MKSCSPSRPAALLSSLLFLIPKVSMMAAQEYDGMKEQLDLEQSLRAKAETYAHQVMA